VESDGRERVRARAESVRIGDIILNAYHGTIADVFSRVSSLPLDFPSEERAGMIISHPPFEGRRFRCTLGPVRLFSPIASISSSVFRATREFALVSHPRDSTTNPEIPRSS
jgi:hypothetical protein